MSQRDGGPAFPIACASPEGWGMSLRDYFAAHAVLVESDIAYVNRHGVDGAGAMMAAIRFQYADAMLAERRKTYERDGAYERAAEGLLHALRRVLDVGGDSLESVMAAKAAIVDAEKAGIPS